MPTTLTLTDTSPDRITLPEDSDTVIIERARRIARREIYVPRGARLRWYGCFGRGSDCETCIHHTGEGACSIARGLVSAVGQGVTSHASITGVLAASGTSSDILLLSLVRDGGSVRADGGIRIESDVTDVSGYFREEHTFLGGGGSIRGIPSLEVASADVRAGHAMRVERISPEKLFYLWSRGLGIETILGMMTDALIERIFGTLRESASPLYTQLSTSARRSFRSV